MLYITEVILDTINVPRDPDRGNEKNVVFGILNFEFNKLHVIIYELMGEITGVLVYQIQHFFHYPYQDLWVH